MAIIILMFLPIFLLIKPQAIRLFASIYSKDLNLYHSTIQAHTIVCCFQKLISNFLSSLFPNQIISNQLTIYFFLFNINSKLRLIYLPLFIFNRYQNLLLFCFLFVSPTLTSVLKFYLHTSIILTSLILNDFILPPLIICNYFLKFLFHLSFFQHLLVFRFLINLLNKVYKQPFFLG